MSEKKITDKELDNVKNYLVISFGYDCNFCVPYKDGMTILAAFENAEHIKKFPYSEKIEFENTTIELKQRIVTQTDYRKAKMNLLLGVNDEQTNTD